MQIRLCGSHTPLGGSRHASTPFSHLTSLLALFYGRAVHKWVWEQGRNVNQPSPMFGSPDFCTKEHEEQNIARQLRAHLIQPHAQRPFDGDALPGGRGARRTQEASGACRSGDFRITVDARPEVEGCYFDTGNTNYGYPVYTENGFFETGQIFVFPFEGGDEGVRARVCIRPTELSPGSIPLCLHSIKMYFCTLEHPPGGTCSAHGLRVATIKPKYFLQSSFSQMVAQSGQFNKRQSPMARCCRLSSFL